MFLNQFLVFALCVLSVVQSSKNVSSKNVGDLKTSQSPATGLSPCQSLVLKATILEQYSCEGDRPGREGLKLRLKLDYKNEGNSPVILYKGANFIRGYVIASNEIKLREGEYESQVSFRIGHFGNRYEIDETPPSKLFEVIRPQGSFEADTSLTVITSTGEPQIAGLPTIGSHVLRVFVGAWPYLANTSSSELEQRWQAIGTLCAQTARSEPIPLQIDKIRLVRQCP